MNSPVNLGPIVQIGFDCVPSSGGTYTLMQDFQRALRAPIISVTEPSLVPDGYDDGVLHVPAGFGPLARGYRIPSRTHPHRKRAEQLLGSARLIVIHGLFRQPSGWAYRIARRQGIPFWVVPHGSLDPWIFSYRTARKHIWMATVGRRLLRDARFVIVASPREDRKAGQVVGARVRRLLIPWPVDTHRASEDGRSRIRRALGIAPEARVLLALGRLHPDKRILELIRAFGGVAAPDLHLVVVGPDSPALTRAECVDVAAHTSDRIHVVGPAWGGDRSAYLDAADGFISMSHRESFGYAVAEAMAAGKPVIMRREAGIASGLGGVTCGWILEGHDEAEARAAIESFGLAPPADLSRLGSAGRAWAALELSFARFEERLWDAASATARLSSAMVHREERSQRRAQPALEQ